MIRKVLSSLVVLSLVIGGGTVLQVMGGSPQGVAKEGTKELKNEATKKQDKRLKPKIQSKEQKTKIKLANVDASKIKVKEVKQLTFDGGYPDRFLIWSPDGTKLLAKKRKGNMLIINVNDGSKVDLGVVSRDYSWSPDGSKILYVDTSYNLCVMDKDGSNKATLTTKVLYPTWSPDGSKIAFYSIQGIAVINAKGSNQIELTGGKIRQPIVWLSSGKIAYVKEGSKALRYTIYTITSDGTDEKVLIENVTIRPFWWLSRSGKSKVCYGKEYNTWIIDEDGGNKIKVNTDVNPEDWSPDGTKFVGTIGEMDRQDHGLISSEICVINYDGTGKNQLTNTPHVIEFGSIWSPTGDKIAYIDLKNENIYVMTLE